MNFKKGKSKQGIELLNSSLFSLFFIYPQIQTKSKCLLEEENQIVCNKNRYLMDQIGGAKTKKRKKE